MNRVKVIKILLVALFISGCGNAVKERVKAYFEIYTSSSAGRVDDRVFGHFVENLGRCFYGGIWDREANVPKFYNGIRQDVANLVKSIRPPVIRYPGGLYADAYHWENGIGPYELRPVIENPYWSFMGERFAPPDTNEFGTDEFMEFLKYVGGEAYIQVNYSTGTTEEAAAWVEYVNGSTSTYWGSLRAQYGHPATYGVRIWGIGNEIWGVWALGHTDPVSYANRYLEFAAAMKKVNPSLLFTAAGYTSDWNVPFLEVAGKEVDYLTIHVYVPGPVAFVPPTDEAYMAMVAAPLYLKEMVEKAYDDIITVLGENTSTKVAFDEWNVGWRANDVEIGREFTVRELLFTAGVLVEFMRLSAEGKLGMANYAQLVNTLGLIYTDGDEVFPTPPYYAFLLSAEIRGAELLNYAQRADTFSTESLADLPPFENVPFIDAVPLRKGEEILMFGLNRHMRESGEITLMFDDGELRRGEIFYTFAEGPYSQKISLKTRQITCSYLCTALLPPHSVFMIKLRPAIR